MGNANYLKGLSQNESGRKTLRVNVFDQTRRQIRCIKKVHDYLGDGTLFTEEELEEGRLYTFTGGSAESYGNVVFLEELPSEYGYQSYLFEELEPYDEAILLHEQEKWLSSMLEAGMEDIRAGRCVPAEEALKELRQKYQIQ